VVVAVALIHIKWGDIMLNKKGTSLMELIISIALISVILVFIMRLLVDLNNMETNNDYAKNNQLIRAEIIRAIENDLNTKTITDIDDIGSSRSNLIINFTFKEGSSSSITATENTLEYTNSNGELRRWTLEEGHIFTESAKVYFSPEVIGEGDLVNRIYTLLIDIEIHTTNDKNTTGDNNPLDDILLNYIGKQVDYNKNITCLGDSCNNTHVTIKTLADYIKGLYTSQGANNLYHHDGTLANGINDGSYRYAGSYETTNNWVCLGTDASTCDDEHLYRIIGVFGNNAKLIKAFEGTEESLGTAHYSYSPRDSENYKGNLSSSPGYIWNNTNDTTWENSNINRNVLNGTYLNKLGTIWANKISVTQWKVGGESADSLTQSIPSVIYENEVINTYDNKTYNSKIGLLYVSDYAFASHPTSWSVALGDNNGNQEYLNWISLGVDFWTITRTTYTTDYAWVIFRRNGIAVAWVQSDNITIRPCFYLNSNVTYVSGIGTKINPIRIN